MYMRFGSIDLSCGEDELSMAYWRFCDGRYQAAADAVIRYIENRSDITFIGDPFPADILDILLELHGDDVITADRLD